MAPEPIVTRHSSQVKSRHVAIAAPARGISPKPHRSADFRKLASARAIAAEHFETLSPAVSAGGGGDERQARG